ncbi:TPA: outer membrane protein assembly factor BamA, partial [Candidatus Poribacteria bacterium]|nr:outer membrane protein assembly factor BamA [Candidatus Poribacteria bacterium]
SAIIIFTLLISAMPIFAEESTSVDSDLIVQEIVISGLKSMDESLIRDLIQTKVGEEISPDKLSKDIKEIYKTTEAFSDISVDVKSIDNGLRVEFILKENPKIGLSRRRRGEESNNKTVNQTTADVPNSANEENKNQVESHEGGITLIGNDKLSKKKILNKITLKPGAFYSEKGLWESTQNILELYRKEGYYLASVDSDVKWHNPDDTVSVTFRITEGERIKVEEVNFIGNEYATKKALRKVMKTREGKRFRDEDFETDLERIIGYYQDRGFMYAKVVDTQKRFTDDKTGIMLDIAIEEGPQFRIGRYDIIFKDDVEKPVFSEEKILSMLQLAEGDIFSKSAFAEDLETIRGAYNDKGYILAQIIPDPPKYDSENGIVEITLRVSEGSIISIGDVDINGLEKTKEPIIRRELNRLDIQKGQPYNVENLRLARQKIYTIGSFIRGVDFRLRQGSDDNQKDLVVQVIETPQTGMFSLFGGYGTEGGILGGLEIGNNNLFGKAYRVHVKGELGTRKRKTGEISFRTPWIFNDPTSLSLSLYSRHRLRRLYYNRIYSSYSEYDDWYIDKRYGGTITLGRPITKNIETSVRFRDENGYLEFPKLLTGEENKNRWYETRSITLFVSRDTRDYRMSLFNPISGSYNSFAYEYSGGFLGADNQFQKYTFDNNWFLETFKNFILATHFQAGYIRSNIWTNAGKLDTNRIWMLSSDRYYLGGIDTMYPVRGYENWSIIPEAKGKVNPNFGGNKMYYLNLEYRYPVSSNLTLLAFYDMGQTWNEDTTNIFNQFSPKKSVGVGVRFELPAMGLIMRLEYGYGFDRENEFGQPQPGGKFHFSLGPAF